MCRNFQVFRTRLHRIHPKRRIEASRTKTKPETKFPVKQKIFWFPIRQIWFQQGPQNVNENKAAFKTEYSSEAQYGKLINHKTFHRSFLDTHRFLSINLWVRKTTPGWISRNVLLETPIFFPGYAVLKNRNNHFRPTLMMQQHLKVKPICLTS